MSGYTRIGDVRIEETQFSGVPETFEGKSNETCLRRNGIYTRERMVWIAKNFPGITYREYFDKPDDYSVGHHRRYQELRNLDGTVIYQVEMVYRCEGPGGGCSNPHGPWFWYGPWKEAGDDAEWACSSPFSQAPQTRAQYNLISVAE